MKESLQPAKIKSKDIRVWALVFTGALIVVGSVQFLLWQHQRAATICWILAACFLLPGLLVPSALTPIYKGWLKFAALLAWVNTRLILGLTFFLVFTPLGILMRLLGKDLIKERWEAKATSYWIEKEKIPFDRTRYEKQY